MSVRLVLDPVSVSETIDYVDEVRDRILEALREGMGEAMDALAWSVASRLGGDPIMSRSGDLLSEVLTSPQVTETSTVIRGTVSTDVGKKHIGLWLEEGTHVPAVAGTLFQFEEPDADTLYSRGHRAFDVKPHPFLNPALHESETTITRIIQSAVEEALAA